VAVVSTPNSDNNVSLWIAAVLSRSKNLMTAFFEKAAFLLILKTCVICQFM
jgi:hypothetical protein